MTALSRQIEVQRPAKPPITDAERSMQDEFLRLLAPIRDQLGRYCRAMAHRGLPSDEDDAKDLMSETILKAYEYFGSLRDKNAFAAYLFQIAGRHSQRQWKLKDRTTPLGAVAEAQLQHDGLAPERSLEAEMLYRAIAQLPEKQAEAIILFEISGLSLEEIREIQGGSLSGVKSRLVRGRDALRELLAERGESTASGTHDSKLASTSPSHGGHFRVATVPTIGVYPVRAK